MTGADIKSDDSEIIPTEDDDDVQHPSELPESVFIPVG